MFGFGKYTILSIDGGGLRGMYPAYLLFKLKQQIGFDPLKKCNLLVGTSTGSIIAAGLATGKTLQDIVQLYEIKGEYIFGGKRFSADGLYASKYSKDALREVLFEEFGNITLGEISKPLIIPVTDIGNGTVKVFRSNYHSAVQSDSSVRLLDAVVASCSAPTYFDPEKVGEFLLADGGLWANNPAGVGIAEALGFFKKHRKQIRLLSLGTGSHQSVYKITKHDTRKWGLLTGWEGGKMIETILGLQSRSTDYMIDRILDPKHLVRVTFSRADMLDLDNPNIMAELQAQAAHDIVKFQDKINHLF
jgi:uncharacterized protein